MSAHKRFRVRGIFGMPVYWFMCKCPGCNEYVKYFDVAILNQRLKQPSGRRMYREERNEETERTPSPSPSLVAELDELSDISERDFQ